ncbi:unnamed protein product [Rotaria magnacalcarata]|uniref:Uncharacterized protein n=1 Tax=Rotaria magnacalcarata TaxID=392030 RepID=A0A819G1J1_9BILA|nr:unnamed protein product [Rotaria magnacalcarata]CAF1957630.1 unnamed protein product [Rotaria magnacalcarata]CAF3834840.1 unnamed protein product [Rotaria magnacalcarata]CAF3877078.1 unnamed protein product [Rotaria magnacalcarata]
MASSNNTPISNRITNNYFFYGTHPLKVPNSVPHSNFANQLTSSSSEQNTHHLSLHLTNSYKNFSSTSDIQISQSLRQLPQSSRDEDEMSEIFEDAVESFDDENNRSHKNRRRSSSKQHEIPQLDLLNVFTECQQITKLFLENHLNEALAKTKAEENRSFYHGLCHSTTCFLHAAMTFNQTDIEAAIQALRHTSNMAKKFEPYRPWIPFNLTGKAAMTEHELHAKLVYAEALLIRALLTFIQDQSLFSFISGALKIKECHDLFLKLAKQNDPSRFSSSLSHDHFDSGVRLGNGAFNLMISNLPQRFIRYLEFAGFSGNREFGLRELEKSATSDGLRAAFSALLMLSYHTVVLQVLGNCDGDLETCHMLVERYLKMYPDVSIAFIGVLYEEQQQQQQKKRKKPIVE